MRNTQHETRDTRRRGFTLIEVLVVVSIIIILAAITVAIGSAVKNRSARSGTKGTLVALQGAMHTYLDKGNPEPGASMYSLTDPRADDRTGWVLALMADPAVAKSLGSLPHDQIFFNNPPSPPFPPNPRPYPVTVIVDSWGSAIRYVPSNPVTKQAGYFQSRGPDRVWQDRGDAEDHQVPPPPPPPVPTPTTDDVFSNGG